MYGHDQEGALPGGELICDDVQVSTNSNSFDDIMDAVRQERNYAGISSEDVIICLESVVHLGLVPEAFEEGADDAKKAGDLGQDTVLVSFPQSDGEHAVRPMTVTGRAVMASAQVVPCSVCTRFRGRRSREAFLRMRIRHFESTAEGFLVDD